MALRASDATNLSDVLHLPSGRFLQSWFVRLRPSFGPAPIWRPLTPRPGWVWAYNPGPCGPVMQLTYQMFIIYLVQDFCELGLYG